MASDPRRVPCDARLQRRITLSGEDADELRGYWEKLSDGGMPPVYPAGTRN